MEQAIENKSIKTKDVFLKRIALIDLLRGICMILVIFDHLMWNFGYFFPKWSQYLLDNTSIMYHIGQLSVQYWYWPLREAVRFFALGMFVLLSGISVAFSKDNSQRAIKMIGLTVGLSLVTNIINGFWPTGCAINFNVIAVISFCVLLYCFVCNKTYRSVFATFLILFVVNYSVLPLLFSFLEDSSALLFPLWAPNEIIINGAFYVQADYMPFFPFCLFFFIGVILSIVYYFPRIKKKELGNHYDWQRPFCFIGRHSLLIYLAHQIILQSLFMLIGVLFSLPI